MESGLLPFDTAMDIVLSAVPKLSRENVGIIDSRGRILARDVKADRDLPPFDRSALDGNAVRTKTPFGKRRVLPIVAEVAAGERGPRTLKPDTCVRIWTGAAVPAGAQGVVPVEHAVNAKQGSAPFLELVADGRVGQDIGKCFKAPDYSVRPLVDNF